MIQIAKPQAFLTALVGIDPPVARHVAPDRVLQRLRYTPGRTLTETAVETEQAWVEGRLGLAGRQLSTGIVQGLAVAVPDQSANPGRFVVTAGRGIAPGGQDVAVHSDTTLDLANLPKAGGAGALGDPPLGPIVVVLEPIVTETERLPADAEALGAFADQCPPDVTVARYLDFVLQDAARVVWVQLDPVILGADPALAPNVAAERLRQIERAVPAALPWADFGLPLALMLIDAGGAIAWHHRAAVARRGGMLPRPGLARLASLRQSRIDGLVEETARASLTGWTGGDARGFLRHLPPAGLLPRKAWDSRGFFPDSWRQAQAPVPLDQLDAVFEAAAAMAPYDLAAETDTVKWLVPVPPEVYDPDLLIPVADPDFAPVEALLEGRVADTRALRENYRAQGAVVEGVLDRAAVTSFAPDEDEIPGEGAFPAVDPAEPEDFDGPAEAGLSAFFDALPADVLLADQRALVDPAQRAGGAGPFGVTPFVLRLRAATDVAQDAIDFAFNRVQAEIYRLRQIMLDNEEATKLATFPVLAGLAKGTNSYALSEGLKAHFAGQKAEPSAAPPAGGAAPGGGPVTGGGGVFTPLMLNAAILGTFTAARTLAALAPGPTAAVGLPGGTGMLRADLAGTSALAGFAATDTSFALGGIIGDTRLLATEQVQTTAIKGIVDNVRVGLVDDLVLSTTRAKRTGILRALPLPGEVRDTRTVTIADRLKASAALTAKASAVRIKSDVLRELLALDVSLTGLRAPLTSGTDVAFVEARDLQEAVDGFELNVDQRAILQGRTVTVLTSGDRTLQVVTLTAPTAGQPLTALDLLNNHLRRSRAPLDVPELPSLVLSKALDPDPVADSGAGNAAEDESAFMSSAVGTLENTVAILRVVEGRVGELAGVLADAEARAVTLGDILGRWQSALAAADQDLDEARHDLRVGLSLIEEERQRLAALQERRTRIIAGSVKFVAYTRPRALRNHAKGDTPGLLLPGTFEDPLPATLREDVDPPAELADMIAVLREVPIGWLASNPELAAEFVRPKVLDLVYAGVTARAAKRLAQIAAVPAFATQTTAAAFAPAALAPAALAGLAPRQAAPAHAAATKLAGAYREMAAGILTAKLRLDLAAFDAASWQDRQRRALADLSLNDLIESGAQAGVAKRALQEIEDIERVAGGLLQLFRRVPPGLRLVWAQDLSVFDKAVSLKNLPRLRSWQTIPFDLRRRVLRLSDWLFARMEPGIAEAEAVVSDLVRVTILIASYAPTAEIVAARLEREQPVRPGGAVEIILRRGAPRIGAQVGFALAGATQARGILRDVWRDRARVEIVEVTAGVTAVGAAVQITLHAGTARALTGR